MLREFGGDGDCRCRLSLPLLMSLGGVNTSSLAEVLKMESDVGDVLNMESDPDTLEKGMASCAGICCSTMDNQSVGVHGSHRLRRRCISYGTRDCTHHTVRLANWT